MSCHMLLNTSLFIPCHPFSNCVHCLLSLSTCYLGRLSGENVHFAPVWSGSSRISSNGCLPFHVCYVCRFYSRLCIHLRFSYSGVCYYVYQSVDRKIIYNRLFVFPLSSLFSLFSLLSSLCSLFWVKAENEGLALQWRTHRSFRKQMPSSIRFCSNGCYTTQQQMPTELSNPFLSQQPMLGSIYTCTWPFRLFPCGTI
jgi:hypothetical protein